MVSKQLERATAIAREVHDRVRMKGRTCHRGFIWTMPIGGGQPVKITDAPSAAGDGDFLTAVSSDGTQLLFTRKVSGQGGAAVVNLDGQNPGHVVEKAAQSTRSPSSAANSSRP